MGVFDGWQGLGIAAGAKLVWRERLAMGPEGPWSLAELGFDEADHEKLTRWIRELAPSRVAAGRIVMPEALGTEKAPFHPPHSACFGLLLLIFASEQVRRQPEAEPGAVWPSFARAIREAEAETRRSRPQHAVDANVFLAGDAVRSWVREVIEQAAFWFELRQHKDATQRWMHLVSLQAGFFGDCRTVGVQLAVQRSQSVALLVDDASGFRDVWQALLRFRARTLSEDELRALLAGSPWVLPGQIDPLVEQAREARGRSPAAGSPRDPVPAEALVDDPHAFLHRLLERPRFVIQGDQLRLVSALGAVPRSTPFGTVCLTVDGQELGRAIYTSQPAPQLNPTTPEIVWPRVAPTVRCDLVSRAGVPLTSVSFELWSEAADDAPVAGVVDLDTGHLVDPGAPLPARAGLLVQRDVKVWGAVRTYAAGERLLVEVEPAKGPRLVIAEQDGVPVWSSSSQLAPGGIMPSWAAKLTVVQHATFDRPEAVVEVELHPGWKARGAWYRNVQGRVEPTPDPCVTRLRFPVSAAEARPSATVRITVRHPNEEDRVVREKLSLAHGATREIAGRWFWIDPAEELDVDDRLVVRFLGSPEVPDAAQASLHPFVGFPGGVSAARPRRLHATEVFTNGAPLVAWSGQPPWSTAEPRSTPIARAVVARGLLVDFAPHEDALELFLRNVWEPPKDTFVRWLHADGTWGEGRLDGEGPPRDVHVFRAPGLRPPDVVAVRLRVESTRVGLALRDHALDLLPPRALTYWVVRSFDLPIARDDLRGRIEAWARRDRAALQAVWLVDAADAFDDQGQLVTRAGAPVPFSWADVTPEPRAAGSAAYDGWLGLLNTLPSVFTWPDFGATTRLVHELLPVLGQPVPGVPLQQQTNDHPIAVRVGRRLLRVGSRALVAYYELRGQEDLRVFHDRVTRLEANPHWVDGEDRRRIDAYAAGRAEDVPAPLTREEEFAFYALALRAGRP